MFLCGLVQNSEPETKTQRVLEGRVRKNVRKVCSGGGDVKGEDVCGCVCAGGGGGGLGSG